MASLTGDRIDVVLQKQLSSVTFLCNIPLCGTSSEAVLHVAANIADRVAKCTSVTVMYHTVRMMETTVHLYADNADGLVLLHPAVSRGPYQIAELFGGLAGWSHACHHVGARPIAIVDSDPAVCAATAHTFGVTVMSIDEYYQHALTNSDAGLVVVQGSVDRPKLWAALSLFNVSVVLASPPCQPWSTTGRQSGLGSIDGSIFTTTLENCASLRVHAVLCENVAGFVNHHDYQQVITIAALKGLRLVCNGLVPCQKARPVIRNRWLGVFLHASLDVDTKTLDAVKALTMPSVPCAQPSAGPSLRESDAIHVNVTHDELVLLTPSPEAVAMMKRSDMIPEWLADKVDWRANEPVLSARMIGESDKLSGVMARYGNQHKLPQDLLCQKGLHTMLFGSITQFRLFSPWEVLAALGFPATACVTGDLAEAFQQSGNAISPTLKVDFVVTKHGQGSVMSESRFASLDTLGNSSPNNSSSRHCLKNLREFQTTLGQQQGLA
eukprot:Skav218577  [mRNA]  locus=scaffold2610:466196:467680:+ [translate_table: standard]